LSLGNGSTPQTVMIVVVVLLAFALTGLFALRAIMAAKDRRRDMAVVSGVLSLMPLPILWAIMNSGPL